MLSNLLLNGFISPEHRPQFGELIDGIEFTVEEQAESILADPESYQAIQDRMQPGEVNKPLTEAEALAVDQRIEEMIEDLLATEAEISTLRKDIDKLVSDAPPNFEIDISKKKALKKAVSAVFSKKHKQITYEMYKAALEARRVLEEEESSAYVATRPKTPVDGLLGVSSTASGTGSRVSSTASGTGSRVSSTASGTGSR